MLKQYFNILNIKSYMKSILIIILTIIFAISIILNKRISKSVICNFDEDNGEWLTVSVTSTNNDNRSDIWLVDTKTEVKEKLVENREPMISGKINTVGDILIYSDAIGNDPWDIFRLNINSKEINQITNDSLGEFNLQFGDEKGNIIFAKSGDKNSPIPQISQIDVNEKERKTIELGSTDLGVQDFDISDNKIIVLAFSYNEYITKKFKENDDLAKINYCIIEMNMDGSNTKVITEIKASTLDSISLSKSKDSIILGGKGINDNEKGFYKLDLKSKEIHTLLTQEQLVKSNEVLEISRPYIAVLSSNGKKLYFAAVPTGTSEKTIYGNIIVYPNVLYCYNLEEKKLNEFFKIPDTFISNISFTYK
ncbi:hypothetical protein [Clostridium ihumii]|uniref:hypothetical protein n=1 Tax=Clostridium ihumii TaxID=1470356 RepID=UPI00058E1586|nr:hypothetical protein [Clostridium ihumii]